MQDFDANVKEAIGTNFPHSDDAKLASLLREVIQDFDARSKWKLPGDAKQGAKAANSNGFSSGVQRFASGQAAEDANGYAD
ncbi:MAG TPA: hypothetical protein VMU43_04755 [Candidatus Acidoferrum sp.]|nr:hypothetical protein [Candidatus Acidoferrum sp.]